MIPPAAALVVAIALGETGGRGREERQPAPLAAMNAARAHAGLLPRKAPSRSATLSRAGHRILRAPGPTYLGEPGEVDEDVAAPAPPSSPDLPPPDADRLALSALGVTTDVTLSLRYDE